MARRKRIEAPSAEDLRKLDEAGFAAKPPQSVPIAQIAGEAAALASPLDDEAQAERAEAEVLRKLRQDGWEVREIAVADVHTDAIRRDRMTLEPDALEELRQSIRANGLRMPIEVSQRNPEAEGKGGVNEGYDLISGLRRLTAVRDVMGQGATIRALVRPQRPPADMLEAMIEENEIRADLTSYERGRAAVMAVEDGVFATLEDAVNALFSTASKAKRSKVRSFARLHEELGDLLSFPRALSERQCLQLAAALKAGEGAGLRAALGSGQGVDAATEWSLLDAALRRAKQGTDQGAHPGKARKAKPQFNPAWIPLAGDRFIHHSVDDKGHLIRFEGPNVDNALVEAVMAEIERLLGEADA